MDLDHRRDETETRFGCVDAADDGVIQEEIEPLA